jgi:hypothetical protein
VQYCDKTIFLQLAERGSRLFTFLQLAYAEARVFHFQSSGHDIWKRVYEGQSALLAFLKVIRSQSLRVKSVVIRSVVIGSVLLLVSDQSLRIRLVLLPSQLIIVILQAFLPQRDERGDYTLLTDEREETIQVAHVWFPNVA